MIGQRGVTHDSRGATGHSPSCLFSSYTSLFVLILHMLVYSHPTHRGATGH